MLETIEPSPSISNQSKRGRFASLGIVLPLLFLACFLNKPYHIDDTLFLKAADLMPWQVLGQSGGEAFFLGKHYPHLSPYESTHPLLVPWYLKCLHLFKGEGKPKFWFFHLGFLLFPALMLFWWRQWHPTLGHQFWWLWILAASPNVFVNATNLMTDLAMTAFWCGTLAGTLGFIRNRQPGSCRMAIICLIAALLTSYQSVALFPLVIMMLSVSRAWTRTSIWIPLLPLTVLLIYLLTVYQVSGFFPFLSSRIDLNIASEVRSGMDWSAWQHKLLATFDFLGLGLGFTTPLLLVTLWHHYGKRLLLGVAVLYSGLVVGVAPLLSDYDGSSRWLVAFLVATGLLWTLWILALTVRAMTLISRNPLQACLLLTGTCLFLGVTFYNILLLPYGTARYVIPAIPGALFLLALHWPKQRASWLTIAVLLASLTLSMLMAAVDFRQAQADWLVFETARAEAVPGQVIRYSDDAGLSRYLAEPLGAYITADQDTLPADQLLLVTRGLIHPDLLKQMRLIREIHIPTRWGLSLFDTQQKAGFYRSLDGLLPLARSATARKAYLYKVIWFENQLAEARAVNLSNPNYFRRAAAEFPELGTRFGLFMHPDARIAYPWNHGKTLVVRGRACPLPNAWEKTGDGVSCTVGMIRNTREEILWQAEVNPKQQVSHRQGLEFEVVVPVDAESIWFQVGPGSAGDYRHDSMLWFDLAIQPILQAEPSSPAVEPND